MNIFMQFFKSLYSPKDIALFRFQGIGKTILYVFFLTLISILPSAYYFSGAASTGLDSAKQMIDKQLPEFSIKNGELITKQKTPLTLEKNNFTLIMDPTGSINVTDLENTSNAFALLKNQFVLIAGQQVQTYPYSFLNSMKVTKDDLINFLKSIDQMLYIMIPLAFSFIYLFSSAVKFIEITVLAFVGIAIKNLTGRKIQYRQLWRLAAYSVTLPTVFFTIMAAIKTDVPNGFILNWFVGIIVLFLALNEMPKPKKII